LRLGLIIFHKNVNRYPVEWVNRCMSSINMQSYPNFKVYELDYGGTGNHIFERSNFESFKLNNHAEAHNYLLDKAFKECDYVFNTNVDDFYALNRIERQIIYLKKGYDVVSSNFFRVNEDSQIVGATKFHHLNIMNEAKRNHNIIAHPVCAYSKFFWNNCDKLKGSEIPRDDFELWKRSYKKGFSFYVMPDYLLYYRIHANNSGNEGIYHNVQPSHMA
jgi:hypothetical protein